MSSIICSTLSLTGTRRRLISRRRGWSLLNGLCCSLLSLSLSNERTNERMIHSLRCFQTPGIRLQSCEAGRLRRIYEKVAQNGKKWKQEKRGRSRIRIINDGFKARRGALGQRCVHQTHSHYKKIHEREPEWNDDISGSFFREGDQPGIPRDLFSYRARAFIFGQRETVGTSRFFQPSSYIYLSLFPSLGAFFFSR